MKSKKIKEQPKKPSFLSAFAKLKGIGNVQEAPKTLSKVYGKR